MVIIFQQQQDLFNFFGGVCSGNIDIEKYVALFKFPHQAKWNLQ